MGRGSHTHLTKLQPFPHERGWSGEIQDKMPRTPPAAGTDHRQLRSPRGQRRVPRPAKRRVTSIVCTIFTRRTHRKAHPSVALGGRKHNSKHSSKRIGNAWGSTLESPIFNLSHDTPVRSARWSATLFPFPNTVVQTQLSRGARGFRVIPRVEQRPRQLHLEETEQTGSTSRNPISRRDPQDASIQAPGAEAVQSGSTEGPGVSEWVPS